MPFVLTEALADEFLAFEVDEIVSLYTVDGTAFGAGAIVFSDRLVEGAQVAFDGVVYPPAPVSLEGLEWSGAGAPPEPTVTVGLAQAGPAATLLLAMLEQYQDMIGATFTRVQTLRKYLDGQPTADPTQTFGREVWQVRQKTRQTPEGVTWVLRSAIDQEDAQIPRRTATNRCRHVYRVAAEAGFDYSVATCPYTGPDRFDALGAPVATDADDVCGKTIRHCKLRFGGAATLPFLGFPGVGRFRQR